MFCFVLFCFFFCSSLGRAVRGHTESASLLPSPQEPQQKGAQTGARATAAAGPARVRKPPPHAPVVSTRRALSPQTRAVTWTQCGNGSCGPPPGALGSFTAELFLSFLSIKGAFS